MSGVHYFPCSFLVAAVQLFPLVQTSSLSPVNSPARFTPAAAVSPLREVAIEVLTQSIFKCLSLTPAEHFSKLENVFHRASFFSLVNTEVYSQTV